MHLVLGRVAGAPDGVKGISLFVVPKFLVKEDGSTGARNDVHCLSIERKLGIHASPTCVLAYGQNGGALAEIVGEENRGLEYMFIMMNAARYAVGLEGVGLAQRAYQTALEYARGADSEHGSGSARRRARAHHPPSRRTPHAAAHEIADRSHARSRGRGRGVARRGAPASGRRRAGASSGIRRPHDSRGQGVVHRELGRHCLARHSSARRRGIRRGDGRRSIYARCTHYADLRRHDRHPSQRFDRRKLARDSGRAAQSVIDEMHSLADALASAQGVPEVAESFTAAVQSLEQAIGFVVRDYATDIRSVSVGAVPLLKLFGIVAGGWQLLRSALISRQRLAAAGANDPHERVLPRPRSTRHAFTRPMCCRRLPVLRTPSSTVRRPRSPKAFSRFHGRPISAPHRPA